MGKMTKLKEPLKVTISGGDNLCKGIVGNLIIGHLESWDMKAKITSSSGPFGVRNTKGLLGNSKDIFPKDLKDTDRSFKTILVEIELDQ